VAITGRKPLVERQGLGVLIDDGDMKKMGMLYNAIPLGQLHSVFGCDSKSMDFY